MRKWKSSIAGGDKEQSLRTMPPAPRRNYRPHVSSRFLERKHLGTSPLGIQSLIFVYLLNIHKNEALIILRLFQIIRTLWDVNRELGFVKLLINGRWFMKYLQILLGFKPFLFVVNFGKVEIKMTDIIVAKAMPFLLFHKATLLAYLLLDLNIIEATVLYYILFM